MSVFPPTPSKLIRSLKGLADAQDEERWARFVELYKPAIRDFIRLQDPDMSDSEWKNQDEERKAKLAIEAAKAERVKQLEKMSEEERKIWLEQHAADC